MARRAIPLIELTRARLLEFVREREAIFWVFVFPVILALALGIAFRSHGPQPVRAAVVNDRPAADEVVAGLRGAAGLVVESVSAADAEVALRTGRVDVVVVPDGVSPDGRLAVTFRADPTRPEARVARLAVADALRAPRLGSDPLTERFEPEIQPGGRYIDFLIPGLIGLNLMGSGLWGIGFALVTARTRKLLKRLAATPMRRSDFLLSFALSRFIFLVPEVAALTLFGWLVFDVHIQGSVVSLGVVALLGGAAFSSLGLLVAARPTTIEGASGWMNLVMLPMWVLSGSFFSYQRFPEVVQPAIRLLPLTALNDALRAVMNEGAPLAGQWHELVVLLAWTAICFALALRIFRWQ